MKLPSLTGILTMLSAFANAFVTLGANKGKKIDLQAEAIIAKAEKKAAKRKKGTARIKQKVTKEQWFAELALLDLKRPKRIKRDIEDIIEAGGEITSIKLSSSTAVISYILRGEKLTKETEI